MEKVFCLPFLGHTQGCNFAHEVGIVVTIMWQQSPCSTSPSLVSLWIGYKLWNHCFFYWLGRNEFLNRAFILFSKKTHPHPFPENLLGGANQVMYLQLYKDLLCRLLGTKVKTVSHKSRSPGLTLKSNRWVKNAVIEQSSSSIFCLLTTHSLGT